MQIINDLLPAFLFFVFVPIVIYMAIYRVRYLGRLQRRIKARYPDAVFESNFPIPQECEDIMMGALRHTIQSFSWCIIHPDWIYMHVTKVIVGAAALSDQRPSLPVATSVLAYKLPSQAPFMVIRRKSMQDIIYGWTKKSVATGELVWCEGVFDKDYDLFCEDGWRVDALSILSPDILHILAESPVGCSFVVRKNWLYIIIPSLRSHANQIDVLVNYARGLSNAMSKNIHTWSSSSSNSAKLIHLDKMELGVTLREGFLRA